MIKKWSYWYETDFTLRNALPSFLQPKDWSAFRTVWNCLLTLVESKQFTIILTPNNSSKIYNLTKHVIYIYIFVYARNTQGILVSCWKYFKPEKYKLSETVKISPFLILGRVRSNIKKTVASSTVKNYFRNFEVYKIRWITEYQDLCSFFWYASPFRQQYKTSL